MFLSGVLLCILEAFVRSPMWLCSQKKQGVNPWKRRLAWEEQGGFHWIQAVLIGSWPLKAMGLQLWCLNFFQISILNFLRGLSGDPRVLRQSQNCGPIIGSYYLLCNIGTRLKTRNPWPAHLHNFQPFPPTFRKQNNWKNQTILRHPFAIYKHSQLGPMNTSPHTTFMAPHGILATLGRFHGFQSRCTSSCQVTFLYIAAGASLDIGSISKWCGRYMNTYINVRLKL